MVAQNGRSSGAFSVSVVVQTDEGQRFPESKLMIYKHLENITSKREMRFEIATQNVW
jgi:hypothetical protein